VTRVRHLERKRDEGAGGAAGRAPTVGQWLEHWLEAIASQKVRPSTLTRYRQLVGHQLTPKVGNHRLDRLQPEHVERMYVELLAAGLSPASVLQVHRVLSRALKVAMQWGRVSRNVCSLVDAPSVSRSEVKPLTADEVRRVLRVASSLRHGARWSLALALGLRQGEALGMPSPAGPAGASAPTRAWTRPRPAAVGRRPPHHRPAPTARQCAAPAPLDPARGTASCALGHSLLH